MGIINFQGKRSQGKNDESTPILVSDYMTKNVITFKADEPIQNAIQTFIENNISGGPVVNDNNEVIGIISEGDCIKQISDSRYYNMPIGKENTVEKAMVKNVETIKSSMSIFDAANKFLESKRRQFPILENGKLIGQITQKDILKAALKLKGNTWK